MIEMGRMKYLDYGNHIEKCRHVVMSRRAYAGILSQTLKNGKNETGGVLIGHIHKGIFYIVDVIDQGLVTTNRQEFFQWDADYVNHLVETLRVIYRFPVTIIGFWHRHPGDMDFFSPTDENTIRSYLKDSRFGLLSMLVNIDPKFRMTFYYCWKDTLTRVGYDVGDEYFPAELLEYADASQIIENAGTRQAKRISILPNKVYDASSDLFPKTLFPETKAALTHGTSEKEKGEEVTPSPQTPEENSCNEHKRKPFLNYLKKQQENYRNEIINLQKIVCDLRKEKSAWQAQIESMQQCIDALQEETEVLHSKENNRRGNMEG